MKTTIRLWKGLWWLLLLAGCSKELQTGTEGGISLSSRALIPQESYSLILGPAPNPTSSLTGCDMQLCLNEPLPEDLYVQLSVRPKNKLIIERELSGADYRIPAGQRYVNIQLPIAYKPKSDTTFSLLSPERFPVIATIKYLTYPGSENIRYSTVQYLVTYNSPSGEEVTFKVLSDEGFIDFRNPRPQPDPTPGPEKPGGPLVPPGTPAV